MLLFYIGSRYAIKWSLFEIQIKKITDILIQAQSKYLYYKGPYW